MVTTQVYSISQTEALLDYLENLVAPTYVTVAIIRDEIYIMSG